MGHLLYSSDDELMTHDQIKLLEPPEQLGRFHHPYPFDNYITDVKDAMKLENLTILNEEFATANNHSSLFGVMEIQPQEGEFISADDWSLLVGLRGSHNSTIARGLVIGSRIMVCSNLCFSGTISLNTKQTTNVEDRIHRMIRESVKRIPDMAVVQQKKFDRYKDFDIKARTGDAMMVELFRRGAMTAQQLAVAVREWDEPSFEDHNQYKNTVYGLFNSCTQALKPNGVNHNPSLAADRSIKVAQLMDEVAKVEDIAA